MWLVFVIISMFISGFLEIIEKKGSNKQPLQFWAIAILLYGLSNVILGIILSPNIMNNFDINIFWLTFPISFLSTIGYYFSIKALNNAPISKVAPILRSKIILVLILSSIFINDKLSILQVILIFLLLILIILLNKDKKVTTKSKKGMIYAFGYLISNGSATFINKIVIDMVPNPISITFYTGLTSILSIVIVLLLINKLELLDIKNFKSKKQVICMESLEAITMLPSLGINSLLIILGL